MALQYHVPGTPAPKPEEEAPHYYVYGVHLCAMGFRMGDPPLESLRSHFYETFSQAELAAEALGGPMCTASVVRVKVYRAQEPAALKI